jgi:hypothetical protein
VRVLRGASEDEIIAAFLTAEIDSGRFRNHVASALEALAAPESIVRTPRLNDPGEAGLRARALAYRGWPSRYLFEGFPQTVAWTRVALTRAELAQTQYPALDEWRRRSPSRLPEAAVAGLRSGALTEPDMRQACRLLAERYRLGSQVPPIIVVSTDRDGRRVVLEGCVRLTALFWESARGEPAEIEAFMGVSDQMDQWRYYG